MSYVPTLYDYIRDKNAKQVELILHPLSGFEIANLLGHRNEEELIFIFNNLTPQQAADTYSFLSRRMQKRLLSGLSPSKVANMLKEMESDECIALLEDLPRNVTDEYLKLLPQDERVVLSEILGYPENSVGRLMTIDYIAFDEKRTVKEAIDYIRTFAKENALNEAYILNNKDEIVNVINVKEFLVTPENQPVDEMPARQVISLGVFDPDEKAIELFRKCGRFTLPVVGTGGVMLGVVTIDDILREASRLSTEKIQKIGAVEALDESYIDTPFFSLIKKRVRWLVLLFLGELLTATAMGFFENELSKAVVLALFLPLIISSGGNAGSQSSTLIIRAMALGEIKLKSWWRVMRWELLAGLLLGVTLGTIGFFRVAIWSLFSDIYGAHWLLIAITIFFSLIGVVLWGSLSGAMLPFILRWFKIDPATSSAPLVATLVDVTGIIIYFTIAMMTLKGVLL